MNALERIGRGLTALFALGTFVGTFYGIMWLAWNIPLVGIPLWLLILAYFVGGGDEYYY